MPMTPPRTAPTHVAALLLVLALAPAAVAQLDADFTVNVTSGTNPFTVQFTDTTTGGPPFVWGWNFGDGHTATGQNPSHTYTLPGTHTVSLSVLGPGFEMDGEVKVGLITVAPQPLTAGFSATGNQGTNPLTVSFTDQSTGNPPTSWLWDFGDGAQSTEQDPTHVYDTPGTFDVTLTAFIDQQSDTTTQAGLVTVDPATLVAAFTSNVSEGDSPLFVEFTDTSVVDTQQISAWLWDFGDGETSTQEAPSHTYEAQEATSFDVTLSVFIGGQSDSVTVVDAIAVKPGLLGPWVEAENYGSDIVGLLDIADLDGDGLEDLLLFIRTDIHSPGRFAYAPNQGPPLAFGAPISFGPSIGQSQFVAWTGDADGDGDVDVLYEWHAGDGLAWFENLDGAGTFAANEALLLTGSEDPSSVLLVDLDGDGDDDVLVVQDDAFLAERDAVWYEHLDGAGTYGPGQILEEELHVQAIAMDDLDGDGDLDLILGTYGPQLPRGLFWYEHLDGVGTFGPANAVHSHQISCDWAAAHDLDGDGDGDLIGRFIDGDVFVGGYQVYENVDGQGTFELARVLDSFYSGVTEFLLDPDGDGDLDLIEVRRGGAEVGGVWWAEDRDGPGLLEPWKRLSVDQLVNFPSFGDVDADGDSDFVFHRALTFSNSLRVRTNLLGTADWPFLGDGLQGSLGMPRLQGEGALVGDESVTLRLTNGLPGASSTLVAGLSLLKAPIKGGVLVPNPDVIVATGPVDADGELELVATWPIGIPAGVPLWFQWWFVDGSGPVGFTASNGVTATTGS
jgi:PKD repeat protein